MYRLVCSDPFLQGGYCYHEAPKLVKCRECRRGTTEIGACRFIQFRRLRYTRNLQLAFVGYADPFKDPRESDVKLWLPSPDNPPSDLNPKMAKYILSQVGDQFCNLLEQEEKAISLNRNQESQTVAWKRAIQGVREMCDVCDTTLFNYHWACGKCGFCVCIDCYKSHKNVPRKVSKEPGKDRDENSWLLCSASKAHEKEMLILCQIIPGDSLQQLGRKTHEVRAALGIPKLCDCSFVTPVKSTNGQELKNSEDMKRRKAYEKYPPFIWSSYFDICNENDSSEDRDIEMANGESHLTLREMLNKPTESGNESRVPLRVMTGAESQQLYPDVPHSWLCGGRLLRLLEPTNPGNIRMFQAQWKRGQPVLVSNVLRYMKKCLWNPESFIRDFGNTKNDLINCLTSEIVPNQYMRTFWEGFEHVSKRLKDDKGKPMILKLKDWPPGEDFAKMLPSRFKDLMNALPLEDYTQHTGQLNLVSRLPNHFIRPDLGPKMYIAYGSTLQPTTGTTNLHLDMSDAVNVMVYVSVPKDTPDCDEYIKEAYRAIDEACPDPLTRQRVWEKTEVPGALWHIFNARDTDKIRDFLKKIAVERGETLKPHHDPIHDQSWYLDAHLRERLYQEFEVEGYAIVQCLGDAIFIPAGAPHQVRNLHNCIKVAEDFVSPENISHCFRLTQEFRELTSAHTNHEDKLQIKNIIYHAVKDSLSVLTMENVETTELTP